MERIRLLAAMGLVVAGCLAGCTSQGAPAAGTTGGPSGTSGTPTPSASNPTGTPGTGGSPGTAPPSGGTTGTEAPPPRLDGPARCSAAVLRGTVQPKDSAAGNRYAELVVVNAGQAPCTLYGYGGLQLLDAAGRPLPTTALRDEPPTPSLVALAPGNGAAKLLHWGVVPTGSEPADRPCQPAPATLSIIPPDETQPFTVPWDLGPVCAAGTIHGSAYYPR